MSEPAERGNRRGQRTSDGTERFRKQVRRGIVLAGIVVVLMFVLMKYVNDGTGRLFDQARAAITATGVITIGGGAVIAYNRQVTLMEQAGLEHSKEARAGRADLHARYQQCAAQLGHEKTMIRIAGVYALEALAKEWHNLEDGPDAIEVGRAQRDVCIDLLCGYLKSKPEFEPTHETPANTDNGEPTTTETPAPVMTAGEADVRLAITTVISRNLQDTDDPRKPGPWSDHDYEFKNAYFAPNTSFNNATFNGNANFYGATFDGNADFHGVTFNRDAEFSRATFNGNANFHKDSWSSGATFTGIALFGMVKFKGDANFDGANFNEAAWFIVATFNEHANFDGANFNGPGTVFTGARVKAPFLTEFLRVHGALELEQDVTE